MANKPRKLLDRYGILIEHLEFDYIGQCADERELEKIVKVLRSGEEGYFSELTTFAEERLKVLNPKNKVFRKETPLGTRETVPTDCWKQISSDLEGWANQMKSVNNNEPNVKGLSQNSIPPIREVSVDLIVGPKSASERVPCEKIQSCDYQKWDRYDPDTELLKMDFDEERHRDFVQNRNQKNLTRNKGDESVTISDELTEFERKTLAIKSKEKGNDYFHSKEFESSLVEYSKSIAIFPTAACFNNRALAYIKLARFPESISDCDDCLKLEPDNVKALLRKAEALTMDDKRRAAYQVYCQVLGIDCSNSVALKKVDDLRGQLPDLPPPNATQIMVEDVRNEGDSSDEDFAALVRPKKITKDRLPDAMKALKSETTKLIRDSVEKSRQQPSVDIRPPSGPKQRLIEEL
ncbi:sperm-associated antigen 1 [Malaya genurostris]|uniref:sperm-associated antigen 1 n=1 Tax=Malaya genurostris TaxID=325434 RepID=UPI0026F3E8F6|nr:sperm-associated antigen 1 [Malaya genurostris]